MSEMGKAIVYGMGLALLTVFFGPSTINLKLFGGLLFGFLVGVIFFGTIYLGVLHR